MCVIMLKPKGTELPNERILKSCWVLNPHGAGVSIVERDTKRVITKKGFMRFEDLMHYLKKLNRDYDISDSVVMIHFRRTSVGKTCKEQCHPFPITKDVENTEKLYFASKKVFAHNGTLPIVVKNGMSDTQTFACKMLPYLKREEVIRYYGNNNRFCIINNDETYDLIGDFIEYKHCYYSNDKFRYFI